MLLHLRSALSSAAVVLALALLSQTAAQAAADDNRVAIVRSNGKLQSGVGIVSTKRMGKGNYEVKIDRSIDFCGCFVTRGSPTEPVARSGYAICHMRPGVKKTFDIRLFNEEGSVEDGPFMLLAACFAPPH